MAVAMEDRIWFNMFEGTDPYASQIFTKSFGITTTWIVLDPAIRSAQSLFNMGPERSNFQAPSKVHQLPINMEKLANILRITVQSSTAF